MHLRTKIIVLFLLTILLQGFSLNAQDNPLLVKVTFKLVNPASENLTDYNLELIPDKAKKEILKGKTDRFGMISFNMGLSELSTYNKLQVSKASILIHEQEIILSPDNIVKIDEQLNALPTIKIVVPVAEDADKIKNKVVNNLLNRAYDLIESDENTVEDFELAIGLALQAKQINDKQTKSSSEVDSRLKDIFSKTIQFYYAQNKFPDALKILERIKTIFGDLQNFENWEERLNLKILKPEIREKYLNALTAIENGDASKAVKLFSELTKMKNDIVPYFVEVFKSQLSAARQMQISKLLDDAFEAYENENYEKALQFLSKIPQYSTVLSPAAVILEETIRKKLSMNSRNSTTTDGQKGLLTCELTFISKNSQGFQEFNRSTDNMVVVYVPEREVVIGDQAGVGSKDEKPVKKIKLKDFYYDKYEVSNQQFCKFLNYLGPTAEELIRTMFYNFASISAQIEKSGDKYQVKSGKEHNPVNNISWYASNAYSLWAWGRNWRDYQGADCALPTIAMFEAVSVCTPDGKLIYPWGDDFDASKLVSGREKIYQWNALPTVAVNSFAQSASFCGIYHLSGNVYEWLANPGTKILYDTEEEEITELIAGVKTKSDAQKILDRIEKYWTLVSSRKSFFPPKDSLKKLKDIIAGKKIEIKKLTKEEIDAIQAKLIKSSTEISDKAEAKLQLIKIAEFFIKNPDRKDKFTDTVKKLETVAKIKIADIDLTEKLKLSYPRTGEYEFSAKEYSKYKDRANPDKPVFREYRGGGFTSSKNWVRPTIRVYNQPLYQKHYIGFRTAIFKHDFENVNLDLDANVPGARFDAISKGMEFLGKNTQGFREYKRPKDGMVMIEIPAGDFLMGSNELTNAKPSHMVGLDMYLIDKFEVSNEQFLKFLTEYGADIINKDVYGLEEVKNAEFKNAKMIKETPWGLCKDEKGNWVISGDPKAPAVGITWFGAYEYARWARCEMPTEAQWEKAARSTDNRIYPWGNSKPGQMHANFKSTYSLRPVDTKSLVDGASAYGCQNLAGNVWEWVQDVYDEQFYKKPESKKINPVCLPEKSKTDKEIQNVQRIARGGGSNSETEKIATFYRQPVNPEVASQYLGFRCVYNGKTFAASTKDSKNNSNPENASWESKKNIFKNAKTALNAWQAAKFTSTKKYGDLKLDKFPLEKLTVNNHGFEEYKRLTDGGIVVRIPAGFFKVGDLFGIGNGNEQTEKIIWVPEFFMDKTEVTNQMFCKFLNNAQISSETSRLFLDVSIKESEIKFGNENFYCAENVSQLPVRNVTFSGANAYSLWAWQKGWINFKSDSCLPTECMFEKAASYDLQAGKKKIYSFGDLLNDRDSLLINREEPGKITNSAYDVSSYGVLNLGDNVAEWCVDPYEYLPASRLRQLSPEFFPKKYVSMAQAIKGRVVRGGSYLDTDFAKARSTYRFSRIESIGSPKIGFRCANLSGQFIYPPSDEEYIKNSKDKIGYDLAITKIKNNYAGFERYKRKKDNMTMVLIPAGEYAIGTSVETEKEACKPEHSVKMSAYLIDEIEVTVTMFCTFLNEYKSQQVKSGLWQGKPMLLDSSRSIKLDTVKNLYVPVIGWENLPITEITWFAANEYAKWAGAFLPSEAQWETAARGKAKNTYPWGNKRATTRLANFLAKRKGNFIRRGGKFFAGNSPFGVKDLAGNVWEWCYDYFDENFYKSDKALIENPLNLTASPKKSLRGGCYLSDADAIKSFYRIGVNPDFCFEMVGFRCAATLTHGTVSNSETLPDSKTESAPK